MREDRGQGTEEARREAEDGEEAALPSPLHPQDVTGGNGAVGEQGSWKCRDTVMFALIHRGEVVLSTVC